MSAAPRPFDLVLFGATGFVGQLTAERLARKAPAGARIALAGRSHERLEAARSALPEAAAEWPIVIADSGDAPALQALAESTRVVVTTVGPYALHGLPLVQACASAGTHYADLTGEVLFIHRSIALTDYAYGPQLRYRESMTTGHGIRGAVAAAGLLIGIPLVIADYWLAPTRRLLDRLLPSPGEGPTQELQERGRFDITLSARTDQGKTLRCTITAEGDPGYRATAVMLSQAGLCLAFDTEQLPDVAGVLTPATAMGEILIDRLSAEGQTYRATVA